MRFRCVFSSHTSCSLPTRSDRDSKSVENPSGGHANAKGSHTATPQSPQSRIKIHAQAGRPGGHVTAVSSRKGGVTSGESNVFKRLGDVDDRNGCIGDSTDVENSLCLGRGAHSGCDTRQSCEPNSCSLTSGAKGCEECGRTADDAHIDQELLQGFGVSVCRECKVCMHCYGLRDSLRHQGFQLAWNIAKFD